MPLYDIIVIGSGPAGLTAAIYATRSNLKTLVIAGAVAGGQLMITTDVENYPGFPKGVQGPELMELWRQQTVRFGADFVDDNVTKVDLSKSPFRVWTSEGEHEGRSVVIATGANAKYLGLPNEDRLKGRGVSACATCDGFFFKGLDVVVVGGGDTAMEESLYLAKLCKTVTVVHRRHAFRASKIMQDRLFKTPNIKVIWDSEVIDVLGDQRVEGVRIKNVKTAQPTDLKVRGLFLAIGHDPATDVLRDQLRLEKGYIVLRPHNGFSTATSVDGVFAAGDVHDFRYRQAVTAAGFGCMAALDAEKWLQGLVTKGAKAAGGDLEVYGMVQGDVVNEGGRLFVDKGAVVRGKVVGQSHSAPLPPPEKPATPAPTATPSAAAPTASPASPKPPTAPGP